MNPIKTNEHIIKTNSPKFHNLLQELQDFHKKKAIGTTSVQQNNLDQSQISIAKILPQKRQDMQNTNIHMTKKNLSKSIDKVTKNRVQTDGPLNLIKKNENYIYFFREMFEVLGLIHQNKDEKQFSALLQSAYENYTSKKRNGQWKQLKKNKNIMKSNEIESQLKGGRLERIKKSYLYLTKGYKFHKYNSSRNKIEEGGQCFLSCDLKFLACKLEGKDDFEVYSMKDYLGVCDLPHLKQTNSGVKMPGLRFFFKQDRTIELVTENEQKKQEFIQNINIIKCCL